MIALVFIFLKLVGVDPAPRNLPIKEKLRYFDALGVALLLASVVCLFIALQLGGTRVPWNDSKPIGLLVGFGLLAIAFGAWQVRAKEHATIPVRFLRDRTVVWGSLYLLWDNMANYIVRVPTPDNHPVTGLTIVSSRQFIICRFTFRPVKVSPPSEVPSHTFPWLPR